MGLAINTVADTGTVSVLETTYDNSSPVHSKGIGQMPLFHGLPADEPDGPHKVAQALLKVEAEVQCLRE